MSRLSTAQRVRVVSALVEGNSIRSTCRMTGIAKGTVLSLLADLGKVCAASRAAMSGIDLVTLAAMLGHSRIQMVLRYAHPTQAHQAQAMKQLERFNAEQQIAAFARQSDMTH